MVFHSVLPSIFVALLNSQPQNSSLSFLFPLSPAFPGHGLLLVAPVLDGEISNPGELPDIVRYDRGAGTERVRCDLPAVKGNPRTAAA